MYPDELYHYGIKGMKWGVRRYQNEDGTRTELGKKRERKGWSTAGKVAAGAAAVLGGIAGKAAYDEKKGKKMPKFRKLSEEEKDFLFTEDQKVGKDKAPISRAEKTVKKGLEATRGISKITGKVASKKQAKKDYESREALRRQAMKMSDDELRKRINRMNLEKQYVDLKSYKSDSGRWSAQEKMDLGMDAIETMAAIGSLALTIYSIKRKLG